MGKQATEGCWKRQKTGRGSDRADDTSRTNEVERGGREKGGRERKGEREEMGGGGGGEKRGGRVRGMKVGGRERYGYGRFIHF